MKPVLRKCSQIIINSSIIINKCLIKKSQKFLIKCSTNNIQKFRETKRKDVLKSILNIVLLIICIIGLLYQSIQLYIQYSSGNTLVKVEYKLIKNRIIPGITVCLPVFFSMEKVVKHLNDSKILNKYNELNNFLKLNNTNSKSKIKIWLKWLTIITSRDWRELFNTYNLSYLFDNFSVKDTDFKMHLINQILNPRICRYYQNSSKYVMSITNFYFPTRKCYTFFSHLDTFWNNYTDQFEAIKFIVEHRIDWFPKELINFSEIFKILLTIHSPIEFPYNQNQYYYLDFGKTYSLKFNEIQNRLLPPPYITNCRNYTNSQYIIRGDCIKDCMSKRLIDCNIKLRNKICINNSYKYLIRKDHSNWMNRVNCSGCYGLIQSDIDYCENYCPVDCLQIMYDLEISVQSRGFTSKSLALIELIHNRLLDQIVEHVPEMNFIEFVSNFGGLLGMWCGFSIIFIGEYFIKLLFNI